QFVTHQSQGLEMRQNYRYWISRHGSCRSFT
ncbi:MAG: hypothetical protein ACI945_001731, partial [Pseudohongiellaceae bacterium]